jgi:hypothetical protein
VASDRRDGRQQTDADGQHQKAEQENCHLGHKASEGKGVGNGRIVRRSQISIQTQMAKKKPYQMELQRLTAGV